LTPAGAYFGLLIVSAVLLFTVQAPQLHGDAHVLALLIVLNIAVGLMPISIYGSSNISIGFVITLAIIVLFGAPGAAILAPIAGLGHAIGGGRRFDFMVIANMALFTVVYSTASEAYEAVATVNPPGVSFSMALGAALATVASFMLTAILLTIAVVLQGKQTLASQWRQHSWLAPHYAALGLVGFGLAAAYVGLGLVGILAFLMPAVMMRFSMKQYVDKTQENVAKLEAQNTQLRAANIQVKQVSDELRESYDGTLEALVNALDARDQETKGHSLRVSRYMMDIARELGVREGTKQWVDMQRGSLLHDVGKIGVTDSILLKPGKLTEDEWSLMRQHPEIGYNMLRQVKFLEGAAEIILSHHERWDGRGYPRGLAQDEIPLGARIFAVVDTFDSMTSDRPYRKALSTMDALNEILRFNGSQFDPMVVEAFLDIYAKWVKEREELHRVTRTAA
jgi:putative nucleotidyltransferase with HDIG domain